MGSDKLLSEQEFDFFQKQWEIKQSKINPVRFSSSRNLFQYLGSLLIGHYIKVDTSDVKDNNSF